jgi:hypothetical protein
MPQFVDHVAIKPGSRPNLPAHRHQARTTLTRASGSVLERQKSQPLSNMDCHVVGKFGSRWGDLVESVWRAVMCHCTSALGVVAVRSLHHQQCMERAWIVLSATYRCLGWPRILPCLPGLYESLISEGKCASNFSYTTTHKYSSL